MSLSILILPPLLLTKYFPKLIENEMENEMENTMRLDLYYTPSYAFKLLRAHIVVLNCDQILTDFFEQV